MKNLLKISALIAALGLSLGVSAAHAAGPRVAVSIAPVHSLALQVMEGAGEPELVMPATVSPHHFALRPSQAVKLHNADLIVLVHPRLEQGLARLVSGRAEHVLVLARDEEALKDPHVWLDPIRAMEMARALAAALAERDPDNAGLYHANAEALCARLAALDTVLRERIAPYSDRAFIVAHNAYSHFERAMGIKALGALSLDEDQPPSIKQVRLLRGQLSDHPGACVFAEPQYPDRQIKMLTEGTGAREGRLDPLGATLKPGGELYEQLMLDLADAFIACFQADG